MVRFMESSLKLSGLQAAEFALARARTVYRVRISIAVAGCAPRPPHTFAPDPLGHMRTGSRLVAVVTGSASLAENTRIVMVVQVDARLVLAAVLLSGVDLEYLCAQLLQPQRETVVSLRPSMCAYVVGPMSQAVEPMYGWTDGVIATM
eukprot:COSAG02_NODE_274_length_26244_cov_36.943507_24_plen_148_part_00